jgi:hypothetical protein
MFLLRCYKRNSDVMAVCYVCYDITPTKIFDVKWKPQLHTTLCRNKIAYNLKS